MFLTRLRSLSISQTRCGAFSAVSWAHIRPSLCADGNSFFQPVLFLSTSVVHRAGITRQFVTVPWHIPPRPPSIRFANELRILVACSFFLIGIVPVLSTAARTMRPAAHFPTRDFRLSRFPRDRICVTVKSAFRLAFCSAYFAFSRAGASAVVAALRVIVRTILRIEDVTLTVRHGRPTQKQRNR